MYAVFEQFSLETRVRAYTLFLAQPLAPADRQPPNNETAFRLATWYGSPAYPPDRNIFPLLDPVGACYAVEMGDAVTASELLGGDDPSPDSLAFTNDYDNGRIADLTDAMGVVGE